MVVGNFMKLEFFYTADSLFLDYRMYSYEEEVVNAN